MSLTKYHKQISLAKSSLRLLACVGVFWGNLTFSGFVSLFLVAEILGILEEIF